jgi:hypothetical protein
LPAVSRDLLGEDIRARLTPASVEHRPLKLVTGDRQDKGLPLQLEPDPKPPVAAEAVHAEGIAHVAAGGRRGDVAHCAKDTATEALRPGARSERSFTLPAVAAARAFAVAVHGSQCTAQRAK